MTIDGSWDLGATERNAVRRHELRQEGFPTAGVSTAPVLERAQFYALHGGKRSSGSIYVIDRDIAQQHGVREYVVSKYGFKPSIPVDEEVILVAEDGGALPKEVIIEVRSIR